MLGGIAVGAVTATATAWLAELHSAARPDASAKRSQVVSTAANLGGIGFGPLVAGALAEWVGAPLTVPYVVALVALGGALIAVALTPETRDRLNPLPSYRPQRVSVPRHAVGRYFAGGIGAAIAFAVFGLFTSLAPSFLAGTLHHPSYALAGATAFAVFGAAAVSQIAIAGRSTRFAIAGGIATMLLGMAALLVAVFLPSPSLVLFEIGGVITGAGAGALFKGVVTSVAEIATPESRAEALAGMFLAGYIGLSIPVLGLGVMTQYLSARDSLAIFTGVLAIAILAATPRLLQRRTPTPERRRRPRPGSSAPAGRMPTPRSGAGRPRSAWSGPRHGPGPPSQQGGRVSAGGALACRQHGDRHAAPAAPHRRTPDPALDKRIVSIYR